MKSYPLIELPGLEAIEAEKGEVIVNNEGVSFDIGGKPHSKGGTKMLAEDGSYILSRKLRLDRNVVKAMGYGDVRLSPAQLADKHPTEKYSNIVNNKNGDYDEISRRSAALMFEKNKAALQTIFIAQEKEKQKRGMKNDLDKTLNLAKFQSGGFVPPVTYEDGVRPTLDEMNTAFMPPNSSLAGQVIQSPYNVNNPPPRTQYTLNLAAGVTPFDVTKGNYSWKDNGLLYTQQAPFSGSEYFAQQNDILKRSGVSKAQMDVLGKRQEEISNLERYGNRDGLELGKSLARYLREADKLEKDQYLKKYVKLAGGTEVETVNATDAQIEQAVGFRYQNLRTGKDDLVDFRDRQNQGWYPKMQFAMKENPNIQIDPLPSRERYVELNTLPQVKPPSPLLPSQSNDRDVVDKTTREGNIVNGVQMGLLALDLATTRTNPPYYTYRPTELAYTRYKPVNTKQQERAFNLAKESIENSNIPQQLKASYIGQLQANMIEGINQVDITNNQNALANDNANISRFFAVRQSDNIREQDANLQYVQEADRRRAQADMQRQVYLSNIMNIWRETVNNRRNLQLINQVSPNYDYNQSSNQVQYQRGSQPTQLPDFRVYGQ